MILRLPSGQPRVGVDERVELMLVEALIAELPLKLSMKQFSTGSLFSQGVFEDLNVQRLVGHHPLEPAVLVLEQLRR